MSKHIKREPENPAIIEYFKGKIGQTVTVETPAGTVSGVVLIVGTDVIQFQEPTGDIVLVLASQINAVYQ
ncbi:DUF2642 domain-containing protein [Paenibacillus pinihumi]|uniref:DUF2642 domain-containing protein n=1 Tax=Paenibacillus pinihumi TaxID=669462 RepID=UPI000400ABF2|nr:DUF2642 domain-containing protein [Paenibacillus pinihumi]